MRTPFEIRESKRLWAINNPAKVRESNRRWRLGRETRLREQARIRMKRYRAKHKSTSGSSLLA